MSFELLKPQEILQDAFSLFRRGLPLLTAEHDGRLNTMTIGWGSLGVLWGLDCATVMVRPQRHTFPIIEAAQGYTLCVLDEERKEDVAYCGRVSGRDEDKIAHCAFTVAHREGLPYFEESRLVIFCRKLHASWLEEGQFADASLVGRWYPEKDFHRIYTGEITGVFLRK